MVHRSSAYMKLLVPTRIWFTVSYAADKSTKVVPVIMPCCCCLPTPMTLATVLFSVCSTVTVECCVLYPCCMGVFGMFAVM